MPSIKNFDKKAAKKETTQVDEQPQVAKRRPGRDATEKQSSSAEEINVVDVDHQLESHPEHQSEEQATSEHTEKIEINFPGSELVRSKFPQPFELAEAVVTDWVKDGEFKDIPVKNELAKSLAVQGLVKAKELEKKVMASPTTEKIAMQAFTYGMKLQSAFSDLKSKIKNKK